MMTFGLVGLPFPSLAAMADSVRAKISREALHQRFTDKAVEFLKICVVFVSQCTIAGAAGIDTPLLKAFSRVLIIDSTSWDVAPALRDVFPGSGGSASAAGCKIQLCYEYLRGALSFFEIGPSNCPDNGWSKNISKLIQAGDLLITDLGYFCLQTFKNVIESGAYFLSRYQINTAVFDAATGKTLNLCETLRSAGKNTVELKVRLGADDRNCIMCRLVGLRVSSDIAKKRRDKLTRTVLKKRNKLPHADSLYLCYWTIMLTNAPDHLLKADTLRPLYSLRWQIELLFKQLKSVLAVHRTCSGKEPRVQCELLGRMIVAIITHKIHTSVNVELWNSEQQEISMEKLHKRIRERASTIKDHLLNSVADTLRYIEQEIRVVLRNCRKHKQKSRPTSLECLHNLGRANKLCGLMAA